MNASVRRHIAYKIYLRVAAAKRWEIKRMNSVHRHREQDEVTARLRVIDWTLQNVGEDALRSFHCR
jgi:hypothetical protein